jgi:PAS domain S-box-containing protein
MSPPSALGARPIGRTAHHHRLSWANLSILAKGLVVVLLPVVALVVSSGLTLRVDSARASAQQHQEAADDVGEAVNSVRSFSTAAITDLSKYFIAPGPSTLATVRTDVSGWQVAALATEQAATNAHDGVLSARVRVLSSSSSDLSGIVERLLAQGSFDGQAVSALLTTAATTNTTFEAAINSVSDRATSRSDVYLQQYDRLSSDGARLVLATTLLGISGAIVAMLVFALAIRRRLRLLEANARALGDGRALEPLDDTSDELGQLGRGLEQASELLQQRENALQESADTLRGSEKKLALALEAGAMGIWDVDLISGEVVWDPQISQDHGRSSDSFRGGLDGWMDLVHPDDRSDVLAKGSAAMVHGGRWSTSYRTVLEDGSVRWIETSGMAVSDATGKVIRIIGVSSDVTERKLHEQILRDAIDDAERADRAKSEFLSRVSHELRTPLNAILGFGQLLAMDDLEAPQRESVDQVLSAGRHLLAVVDDVLDISRVEAGNLALSMEPVGLAEVLAETMAMVSGSAAEHGVAISSILPHSYGVHVLADRRRLKQILLNLASNAVKFNRPGGSVTFSCSTVTPGLMRVAVADTGNGIPADRLARLFTPFDRLGAEQTSVDGTGIGLALSKRLAELQGAALSVQSEEGVGSTFWLEIPIADDPLLSTSAAGLSPTDQTADSGHVRTILYVEDNPSNLRLVQRVLDRRGGIRLLAAGTGRMALTLAAQIHIDLVLLDLHLPDMGGEEVLTHLRSDPGTATTPVVVLTADASPGLRERLQMCGADEFLTKPLELVKLMRVLDNRLTSALR